MPELFFVYESGLPRRDASASTGLNLAESDSIQVAIAAVIRMELSETSTIGQLDPKAGSVGSVGLSRHRCNS